MQLGMCIGGAIRGNGDHVCIMIDLKNAFKECIKASTIKGLEAEEFLAHLAIFVCTALAPDAALESGVGLLKRM